MNIKVFIRIILYIIIASLSFVAFMPLGFIGFIIAMGFMFSSWMISRKIVIESAKEKNKSATTGLIVVVLLHLIILLVILMAFGFTRVGG